jgi:hypothetical protein
MGSTTTTLLDGLFRKLVTTSFTSFKFGLTEYMVGTMRLLAIDLIASNPMPDLSTVLASEGRTEASVNTREALAGLLANHM